MALNETLAGRIREALAGEPNVCERRMFGGLAFMLNGNMCCGVLGDELMLRLGDNLATAALKEPHTRPMDFTGRVIRSMLFVGPQGLALDEDLARWVRRAAEFASGLPPK